MNVIVLADGGESFASFRRFLLRMKMAGNNICGTYLRFYVVELKNRI